MTDDRLCLVFTPALIALLIRAEKDNGSPLTESEVFDIRDRATCMAVRYSVAVDMEKERGYPDIVAEDAWNEWCNAREKLF